MGGGFAAQMGAPLTAQPIEIEALEVGDDRQTDVIDKCFFAGSELFSSRARATA